MNTLLVEPRVKSEHCIGLLKGRFPWLRSIRLKITEDKKSLKRILALLEATVILHNMLIDIKEREKQEWIDRDDFSDFDDEDRAPVLEENRVLVRVVPF